MPSTVEWKYGDRVVHLGKPEWGTGVVTQAQRLTVEGKPCQRLTIRFDRAGLKTISTAFAHLGAAADHAALAATGLAEPRHNGDDPFREAASPVEVMTRLPEAATDPFSSLASRLRATLDLYRFTSTGGSLLDWAVMQSGLTDPLSRFNRHELEQLFARFVVVRDEHLRTLSAEIGRTDPALLEAAAQTAPPDAKRALKRGTAGR